MKSTEMTKMTDNDSAIKYHAACGKCRDRKLKCTGHRPQCDRCRKDQVTCNYSPRKRMGRPRKLQPQSPSLSAQSPHSSSTRQDNSYITPEPVPQFRDMHYQTPHDQSLPEWVQLFDEFELRQIHNPEAHNPPVYDLDWPREEVTSEGSLGRHAYGLADIHAPIPIAPISNHLTGLEPGLHGHHGHAPRIHISSSPGGSVSFDYPSPSFTSSHHIVGPSPPPPMSLAGSPPSTVNMSDALRDTSPPHNCDCIFNFLMSITLLKTHLTKLPIPFQAAISTSRSAIATASYSLSCPSCQNGGARSFFNNDIQCISDMFLGALLPMLCQFYTNALESIESMTGFQKVRIEGHEMDIEIESWKDMARFAMVKEASRVNKLVDEMGKLSMRKNNMLGGAFCYSADALWEPLCSKLSDMARNSKKGGMERVFSEHIGVF